MKKRLFVLVIAVIFTMVAFAMPMPSLAAGHEGETTAALQAASGKIIAKGTCGKNVTWKLDDGGVLFISGTGAMKNYTYASGLGGNGGPWAKYENQIRTVKIGQGVTSVGNYAFYDCKNLKKVSLPAGLKKIGEYAFAFCEKLSQIKLPKSLEMIDVRAFDFCTSLKSITLPKNLKKMESGAFARSGLTSIEVPASLAKITDEYSWFDGCKSLKSVKLPAGLNKISAFMFGGCTSLKSITIPKSVTSIGYCAFEGCKNLQKVNFPSGLKELGSESFMLCESLTSVELPEGLTTIGGECVFERCTKLKSVTIPKSVKKIGNACFWDCPNLKTVYYNGTSADWKKIKILEYGNSNKAIKTAKRYKAYPIKATVGKGGKVSSTGTGLKGQGQQTTLTAKPGKGYYFAGWKEGNKTVSTSQKYTFKVSKARTLKATFVKIATPKVTGKATGKTSVKLSWRKVAGATGYQIYRASSKNGKYVKVAEISKGSTLSYTDKKLSPGKTYYYKVRAVAKGKATTTYGKYAAAVRVKTRR